MTNCLVKSITLYVMIMSIFIIIKPQIFYYDTNKIKLKPWNLYKDTQVSEDAITLHSCSLIISILVFMLFNY